MSSERVIKARLPKKKEPHPHPRILAVVPGPILPWAHQGTQTQTQTQSTHFNPNAKYAGLTSSVSFSTQIMEQESWHQATTEFTRDEVSVKH